ncbi:MAG: asparagine synthase (glutamine-hydrolyzing) [Nitrospira sp.]
MCGIGGVFLRQNVGRDSVAVTDILGRMVNIQRHRGPDGQGLWRSVNGDIGLCHTRLAILDLTASGNQPMSTTDGLFVVVFNGEIYNWKELRTTLEAKGVLFKTGTDTEVLLEAYREFGEDIVSHLRGMFAFALYDQSTATLFCARDRMGKKPFVYAETRFGFAFASEIPAVTVMPGCDTEINGAALAAMLLHNMRHIPDPHTVYRGVRRLRPGHAMIVTNGKINRMWRYWIPQSETDDKAADRLRPLIEDAVMIRMVADVPVGALLSGGVDSSAIVSLMKRHSSEPVRTYALGFDRNDEDLRRARSMAQHLGCIHKEYYFEPKSQWDAFRKILVTYGEPIMLLPLIHTFELCNAVHQDGIKVVLSGHGADEVFYGYTGNLATARFSALLPWLAPLTPFMSLCPRRWRRGPLAILGAKNGARKAELYRTYESRAWGSWISPDLRQSASNLAAEELAYWGQSHEWKAYIDESNFVALMVENVHSVQIASDLPAMMASVEMRAPFLDQAVVECGFAIPYRKKVPRFNDTTCLKQILKTAVEDLVPGELLYAPKRGFGMGVQERMVLEGPWRNYADECFAQADDLGGVLVGKEVRRLWGKYQLGGEVESSLIGKLLAMYTWQATLN